MKGKYRPVVLFHGLLASAEAMSHAQKWIEADFPGIYTLNCEVGDGKHDSLEMPMDEQAEKLAHCIQSDKTLREAGSFNLIGHSQGGLLTRAYVERYNDPPVHNLLSWAGPHGGQYGVPDVNAYCHDDIPGCAILDDLFDLLLNGGSASEYVQKHVSFATYWRDPYNVPDYLKYSEFLADVNNDRAAKNATYKKHLSSLNTYLLLYSSVDTIVIPRSSPWFQYYEPGQESKVLELRDTPQYKEDW
jgi:palmitoyl-protein thioesterase